MFDLTYKKVGDNTVLFKIPKDMAEEHAGDYIFMCKFKQLLADGIISYNNNFVFDFKNAEYIFEHLLHRLPWLFQKVRDNNAGLVIITHAKGIKRQFFSTSLIEFIPIVINLEEALKEIEKIQNTNNSQPSTQ
ncbi:MAG: hypothetical protein M1338_03110 [Patescibacteria group bacterium]|nr:hypothetical protein [Patescibacteria group bacterium]